VKIYELGLDLQYLKKIFYAFFEFIPECIFNCYFL